MNKLTIRPQSQNNTTTIENHFIDVFMPRANGEFVKIYLYLVRIMNDPTSASTLSTIADNLEHTEKDLMRGLNYWEKEGLLNIARDTDGNITEIDMVPASIATPKTIPEPIQMQAVAIPETMDDFTNSQVSTISTTYQPEPNIATTSVLPSLDNFSATCITTIGNAFAQPITPAAPVATPKSNEDFKQLLYIIQRYMERPISKTEMEHIQSYYDDLDFSSELIEYLFEHCVEHNHKSIHYINAVAHAWAKAGIKTVEEAKNQVSNYNKSYRLILRSFGITGREPVEAEISFMDRWMNEFNYSLEMINRACAKTIEATHNPNFKYADSIIANWAKNNVRTLEDITILDEAHAQGKSKANIGISTTSKVKTRPASFNQRDYDFDAINKQLLNAN